MIKEFSGEKDLEELYRSGEEGVYPISEVGGLLTLAYGWR